MAFRGQRSKIDQILPYKSHFGSAFGGQGQKYYFFLIEHGYIVGGWPHNVILKYAYLSHKMQYSMLGDDILRFY